MADVTQTLAIDVMSGDHGPEEAVPAALQVLQDSPQLKLILVGQESAIIRCLPDQFDLKRFEIVHAEHIVGMADKPSSVLRRKQQSSMAVALKLVREGRASGVVSAGNTGALMILARSILGMLPDIERPAIIKLIPNAIGRGTYILDLGANVDCRAEHLLQFAIMGSVLVQALDQRVEPRVALLNIGSEDMKGNEQVRLASRLLQECDLLNYIGYLEGNELFADQADVIVCDGFVGNVALKASEGIAKLVVDAIRQSFSQHWYSRLIGWLALPILEKMVHYINPATHNGASLIGLPGVVVKSHGNAKREAFANAIKLAA